MATKKTAAKKTATATESEKSAYQRRKEIEALAYRLISAFEFGGQKALEGELDNKDHAEISRQALAMAMRESNQIKTTKALEEQAAKRFPNGLYARGNGALPKQLKARTTKQQPNPYIVLRLPRGWEAKGGQMIDLAEIEVEGRQGVFLSPAPKAPVKKG